MILQRELYGKGIHIVLVDPMPCTLCMYGCMYVGRLSYSNRLRYLSKWLAKFLEKMALSPLHVSKRVFFGENSFFRMPIYP